MKKFFQDLIAQKFKPKSRGGQVKTSDREDKLFATSRRSFGLANRLEHIKNRGKQNNKK